jgi:hypothetical protein
MPRPERDRPLIAQGGYYVATGVAPFVSRRLFERVTGPKADWWLVQTVGVLVTAAGAGMVSAGLRGRKNPEVTAIAAGCAAGLAAIDVVHAARGRISPVYLVDAAIQVAALGAVCRHRFPG